MMNLELWNAIVAHLSNGVIRQSALHTADCRLITFALILFAAAGSLFVEVGRDRRPLRLALLLEFD